MCINFDWIFIGTAALKSLVYCILIQSFVSNGNGWLLFFSHNFALRCRNIYQTFDSIFLDLEFKALSWIEFIHNQNDIKSTKKILIHSQRNIESPIVTDRSSYDCWRVFLLPFVYSFFHKYLQYLCAHETYDKNIKVQRA